MLKELERKIFAVLNTAEPKVSAAYIFGSLVGGNFKQHSDIDIAIMCPSINANHKLALWDSLSSATGRAIDLIELSQANPVIVHEAISGKRIIGSDETHAKILSRMLIDNADFGVLRARMLNHRRKSWLSN